MNYSSYIGYPLFRLTLAMAAGIFVFDRLLSDILPWFYVAIAFCFLAVGACLCSRMSHYRWRHSFGCVAMLACFVGGGASILYQRSRIAYDWEAEKLVYEGLVETVPDWKGKTFRAEVTVLNQWHVSGDSLQRQLSALPVHRRIRLYWMPDSLGTMLSCGDRICFQAKIAKPTSEQALTNFDYGDYLMRQGISGTALAFGNDWRRLAPASSLSLKQWAMLGRERVLEQYRQWGLEGDVLAVVSALTVGDKDGLTDELKAIYSAAGTSHVLSLSGLHIGMLAAIFWLVLAPLKRWRCGKAIASVCLVAGLWAFAILSGLSSSVVRAVTMFTLCAVASWVSEERFSAFYSVSLAAFLMLLYQPMYLFDISFQLSFLAVYAILLFYPVIVLWYQPRTRVGKYLWNALSVSLAAQTGTLPLILYYFGTFPTYFLVANLLVGPLAFCILAAALSACVLGFLPFVGPVIIGLLILLADWLNRSMAWIQSWEGAQLTSIHLSEFQVGLLFLLMGCALAFWQRRTAARLIAGLSVAVVFLTAGVWLYLRPYTERFYLYRSEVYHRKRFEAVPLMSASGFYQIDSLRIAVLKDSTWRDKQAPERLGIDYAYICKGFRGNMRSLSRSFDIRQVVFDPSVSDSYRNYLMAECRELQIGVAEMPPEGSFQFLWRNRKKDVILPYQN